MGRQDAHCLGAVPSRPGLPTVQVLTSSSAYIQWTQPGEPRGNLVKYQVLLNGKTVAHETENVNPALLNTTLTGLKDNEVWPLVRTSMLPGS